MVHVTITTGEEEYREDTDAPNLGELVNMLRRKDEKFREMLLEDITGDFSAVIRVNGEDARLLEQFDTSLSPEDQVSFEIQPRECGDVTKELYLQFSPELTDRPVLYEAGRIFGVVVNIKGASITPRKGFAHIEVSGCPSEVDTLIEWLVRKGIRVEEPEPT